MACWLGRRICHCFQHLACYPGCPAYSPGSPPTFLPPAWPLVRTAMFVASERVWYVLWYKRICQWSRWMMRLVWGGRYLKFPMEKMLLRIREFGMFIQDINLPILHSGRIRDARLECNARNPDSFPARNLPRFPLKKIILNLEVTNFTTHRVYKRNIRLNCFVGPKYHRHLYDSREASIPWPFHNDPNAFGLLYALY